MSGDGQAQPAGTGCCGAYDRVTDRLHDRVDSRLERLGWNYRQRLLLFHFLDQLKEQIMAVLPISLLLVFVIGVFFQQATNDPGKQAFGLVCAIFGLMFFMEGLRVVVMPLGEMVGRRLPMRYHLSVVLIVAGCLGILVTYAEPAIASLTPLAKLVDRTKAPYLYYALNDQREMLVLSIGLGVGLAAVVGTLRFVKGWSLKPIIYISLVPTIGLACYMEWGNPDLSPLLGLAWDCGGVTTGPVTVPILLAMGIGVMKSTRQKRLAKAALQNAVDTNTGQTLEGFGVVTLASIFPILAVEIMGIMISVTVPKEDIINGSSDDTSEAAVDKSPTREVIFAIRAIMPLITALLLIVVVLIREPIPHLTVYTVPATVSGPEESVLNGDLGRGSKSGNSFSSRPGGNGGPGGNGAVRTASPLGKDSRGAANPTLAGNSTSLTIATTADDTLTAGGSNGGNGSDGDGDAAAAAQAGPELSKTSPAPSLIANTPMPAAHADGAAADAPPSPARVDAGATGDAMRSPRPHPPPIAIPEDPDDPASRLHKNQKEHIARARRSSADRAPTPHPRKGNDQTARGSEAGAGTDAGDVVVTVDGQPAVVKQRWYKRYGGLIIGVIMAQGGMIAFNIGLTYGFTALGDQAGTLLPAAYMHIDSEPRSPYYSYVGGIILVLVVAWCLGFLATRAEPALRVLGRTVQHLSGGTFTAAMLIYAVSVGVGTGMAVGSTKILFGVPIIYIILIKYAIAVGITIFSAEDIVNVAWDSAGVTTGPVTVPFVLSLGIGFSKATGATEGFGILTAASVAPIISVLLTNIFRQPFKKLMRSISRLSTRGRGHIGRSSLAAMSRRAKRAKDTNAAIDSVAAIAAAAARLENQPSTGGTLSSMSYGSPSLGAPSSDFYAQSHGAPSYGAGSTAAAAAPSGAVRAPTGAPRPSDSRLRSASGNASGTVERPSVRFAGMDGVEGGAAAPAHSGGGAAAAPPAPPAEGGQ